MTGVKWRVGRKVGRTLYVQLGEEPSDNDPLIGVMDTVELARQAVDAVNEWAAIERRVTGLEGAFESHVHHFGPPSVADQVTGPPRP